VDIKVGYSTAMLRVADIERSIRFYEQLGFATVDTEGGNRLEWARLHCEGGAIMFLRNEKPSPSVVGGVELYTYTPDLSGLCEQLSKNGMKVPPIGYPYYMLSGEITIQDPDGNVIFVGHWGKKEQEEWEKRISPSAAP